MIEIVFLLPVSGHFAFTHTFSHRKLFVDARATESLEQMLRNSLSAENNFLSEPFSVYEQLNIVAERQKSGTIVAALVSVCPDEIDYRPLFAEIEAKYRKEGSLAAKSSFVVETMILESLEKFNAENFVEDIEGPRLTIQYRFPSNGRKVSMEFPVRKKTQRHSRFSLNADFEGEEEKRGRGRGALVWMLTGLVALALLLATIFFLRFYM